jgi:eukaryotic-like serine/threonine-protein kinase
VNPRAAEPRREWAVVEAILDAALAVPAEERAELLDRECSDNSTLRREIEELLQSCDEDRGFLETPAGAFASSLVAEELQRDEKSVEGTTVGPYRLIREIARGGMGSVYLAERADGQFEQRVALKLIKRGMDSDEVHRRFLSERRILARLSHPHIARLVDGGMTAEGHPWFAMEFVDGAPITRFCEERGYGITERTKLFQDVCDAVRYAHQNLVVHRDLKPSNILVTPEGQVKLLDFGIAKLLADEPTESPLTQTEMRVMTPEYAAPEQVRGEPVTTATDVYALGTVLYELLSGRRAHQFKRRVPAEIERVVCDVEPEPPSVAASREGGSAARIPGDLDTIVLKALQKDALRRYASAEALLDDLRRFDAGLPVSARPDTMRYRARKFVRRYRVLVAATAVVVITLMAGLAGTLWQAGAASRQARLASAEAAKATEVKDFLVGLFKGSDPTEALRRDISARDLLERGRLKIDTALRSQPDVHAELLDILGVIHGELALFPQADTLLRRSIQVSRTLRGNADSLVSERLAHWATILMGWSKYDRADSVLQQSLAMRRRSLGPDHPDVASTLSQLGEVQRLKGNLDIADSLHRAAVAIHRNRPGKADLRFAEALYELAVSLNEHGKTSAAESAATEALAMSRVLLSRDHPLVLKSEHIIALTRIDQGAFAEAERIERGVLAARRRVYGEEHLAVADGLNALGLAVENQGRLAEAESLYTHALAIDRKTLGDDHNATIVLANNLAVTRYRLRDLSGAVAAMRLARDAWSRTLGKDHLYAVTATNNLGAMLSDRGDYREAEPLIREALAKRQRQFGDSSVEAGQSWRNLGLLLHRTSRKAEAETALRHSLANYQKTVGGDHPRAAEALTALGALLTDVGQTEEAERLLRDALAIRIKALAPADTRIAETRGALGECLTARGRYRGAETLLLDSFHSYRTDGHDAPAIAKARRRLVALYQRKGDSAEAAKYQ